MRARSAAPAWVAWMVLCIAAAPQAGPGLAPVARPAGYVDDLASVFSEEDKRYLENFLRRLERDTSAEVVVVTVPSLDGRTVEEYANGLFAAWGIGKERDDNGVLLLVAPSDRRVRIEVGYGLEPILPDGLAGEIIRDDILPEFRAGNVPRGIGRGLDRISRLIRGDASATTGREPSPGRGDSGLPFIFFFIVPGVVGLAALTLTFGRRCRAGDHSREEARNAGADTSSSPSGSSDSGGSDSSSGGFGGGSSGGGGASGSW